MKISRISLFTLLSLVLTLLLVGCIGQEDEMPGSRYEEFEPIVEEWVEDYVDEISEEMGNRVTFNIPGVKDLAGQAIKDGLGDDLQWNIVEVKRNTSTHENFVRIRLSRTFTIDVDIKIASLSKAYIIELDYILNVKDNVVKDFDIDLDSFTYRTKQ